jgi:hypothetical protein
MVQWHLDILEHSVLLKMLRGDYQQGGKDGRTI